MMQHENIDESENINFFAENTETRTEEENPSNNNNNNNNNNNVPIESSTQPTVAAIKKNIYTSLDIPKENLFGIELKVIKSHKMNEGSMNSYVDYEIQVTTSTDLFKSKEFTTRRRFSEFTWLRENLVESHPGYIIPHLPEKTIINKFHPEVIERRTKELAKFLYKIANHAVMHKSPVLKKFLEATTPQELTVQEPEPKKEEPEEQTYTQSALSSAKKASGWFSSVANALTTKVSQAATQYTQEVKEPDPWFESKKNLINSLDTQLLSAVNFSNSLSTKRKEVGGLYSKIGGTAKALGEAENENSPWLCYAFGRMGEVSDHIGLLYQKLNDHEKEAWEDPIRESLRMLQSVNEAIGIRQKRVISLHQAAQLCDQSEGATDQVLEFRKKKKEKAKEELDSISQTLRKELEVWERDEAEKIKSLILLIIRHNMDVHLQIVDQWKTMLGDVQSDDKEIVISLKD